ncbi:MAG: GNAT family N-acetyltransferase [Treponema sp.]|nr:GNAT family N-acetyltransferase [Treponema sp.]
MTLIPIQTKNDFLIAQQFVLRYEKVSATLASLIRRNSENLVFITNSQNLTYSAGETNSSVENTILGILSLDYTLYHCIPEPDLLDATILAQELSALLKKPVRCISGEQKGTDFLVKVVSQIDMSQYNSDFPKNSFLIPAQSYYYKMMEFLSQSVLQNTHGSSQDVLHALPTPASINISGGEEIIRCTENDMELLHPLQKEYMKEEIAGPGKQIADAEVSIMLRQILKNQICIALLVDGEPVAKANTNAIGFNCVQIGGVFTHPFYRRNGYAAALVLSLCKRSIRANRQPVLFVKEKNLPAYTLYKKLCFTECGHYEIVYF